jgi:hypothetical protein
VASGHYFGGHSFDEFHDNCRLVSVVHVPSIGSERKICVAGTGTFKLDVAASSQFLASMPPGRIDERDGTHLRVPSDEDKSS